MTNNPQPVKCLGRTSITAPTVKGTWNAAGAGIALTRGTGKPDPAAFTAGMSITRDNVGYLRVVIGGKDATFFRGVPTQVGSITLSEPFTDESASFVFPQITPFDDLTHETFDWLKEGVDVEVELVNIVDGSPVVVAPLFTGVLVSKSWLNGGTAAGTFNLKVDCQGLLLANTDQMLAQPQIAYDTMDIGHKIAWLLNHVTERRFKFVQSVTTGISTRSTGAWEPLLTGYIGDLLAQSTTSNGMNQWTLHLDHYRQPVIKLKNISTTHWTTSFGVPGVGIDIDVDATQQPTAIFGRGIDANSQGWGNLKTPGFDMLKQYPYFSANPAATLGLGSTGATVQQVQGALRDVWGYAITVDGVFGFQTLNALKNFQRGTGCVVNGTINGQTWCQLFQVGQRNGRFGFGGLEKAYYAPIATKPEAQKFLYNTSGEIVGENPNYDPKTIPRYRFHSYPDGVSKTTAANYASAELKRDGVAGETGTITFTNVDPQEGSRFLIRPGQNIAVRNFGGRTLLFHITAVVHTLEETELTVDTKARDLLTLDALVARDREALGPGASPYVRRKSILSPDKPVVDGELIGNIPRLATSGKVWNIFAIPLGTKGSIIKMSVSTDTPATRFVMGFFSGRVNHAQLSGLVGDPFTQIEISDQVRYYPFPGNEQTAASLESIGWIDTLGGPENLGGYYPSTQENSTIVTGRHEDANITLQYESFQVPFVWVAFYPEASTFLQGRVWVEPQN